jgi:Zn-dependent oligopeptidase
MEQSQLPGGGARRTETFASSEPPSYGEPLGVLYLDLFPRLGKTTGAALYTLRVATRNTVPTGRAGTAEAMAAITAPSISAAAASSAAALAECDVSALSALYLHLPAAALVINLPMPAVGAEAPGTPVLDGVGVKITVDVDDWGARVGDAIDKDSSTRRAGAKAHEQELRSTISSVAPPVLLSPAQLTTLYHEMGHALHALLSRAPSHHFGGLRVAQDFVEAPSTLMERFVSHPPALAMWATHLHSGRAIPPRAAHAIARAASADRFGRAMRLQLDAVNAMLDLHLHSASPPPSAMETTAVLAKLRARHTLLPLATEGAAPHAGFVHLAPYGAAYYSYLFALSIATRVWRDGGFAIGALSGDAGRAWVELVLRHGGARHPRQLLQSFFGNAEGRTRDPNCDGSPVALAPTGVDPGAPTGAGAGDMVSRTDMALLRLVPVATPSAQLDLNLDSMP